MIDHLPDDSKVALAKQLAEVRKRAGRVQKCLLVQLEGTGRFDAHATRSAWGDYQAAVEEAQEIVAAEVRPVGLFVDAERREIHVELGEER